MHTRSLQCKMRRVLAMMTALSCFWLSAVGSLLHTHGLLADVPGAASTTAKASLATAPHVAQPSTDPRNEPAQCLACEWQVNSVSTALPIFAVQPPPAPAEWLAAPTTSYVRLHAIRSASRAPPVV